MIAPTTLPFGEPWIAAYFAEVDRMDPAALLGWYATDGSFRFAGQPRVTGKGAIARVLGQFYNLILAMRHDMTGVWIDDASHSGVWEAQVTFTRHDRSHVVIPAVSVLRTQAGLVHDFRLVMDPAALYGDPA